MVKPAETTEPRVRVVPGMLFGRVGILPCPCGCGGVALIDTSEDGPAVTVPASFVETALLAAIEAGQQLDSNKGGGHAGS